MLFLDYLIVIALSALFVPHYLGAAFGSTSLREQPVGHGRRGARRSRAIAAYRLVTRPRLYRAALVVALVDLGTQLLLVGLGLALLFSPDALDARASTSAARRRGTTIAFALPLALLAYTGLETVANLAEETRRPGRDLPRSLFARDRRSSSSIYVAIALVGALRLPGRGRRDRARRRVAAGAAHGDRRRDRRASCPASLGDVAARLRRPHGRADPRRRGDDVDLRLRPARVLARRARPAAARRSAGCTGGRSSRRRRSSPRRSSRRSLLVRRRRCAEDDGRRRSRRLFSFGVLLAFSAAQLAVIRLRFTQPELAPPVPRAAVGVRVRGADVPRAVGRRPRR